MSSDWMRYVLVVDLGVRVTEWESDGLMKWYTTEMIIISITKSININTNAIYANDRYYAEYMYIYNFHIW